MDDVLAHGVHEHVLEQELPVEKEVEELYKAPTHEDREIFPFEIDVMFSGPNQVSSDDEYGFDGDDDAQPDEDLPVEQRLDPGLVRIVNEEELEQDDDEEEADTEDWRRTQSFGDHARLRF